MTIAEQDAALAAELRPILDRHFPGLELAEGLVRDLAGLMSAHGTAG